MASTGRFCQSVPLPLRLVTWLVIAVQINCSVPLLAAAMDAVGNAAQNQMAAINATPMTSAPGSGFVPAPLLWHGAEELQIGDSRLFAEPLMPVGQTTSADNQALLAALAAFSKTNGADFSALTTYLNAHPRSAWRASFVDGSRPLFQKPRLLYACFPVLA